MSAHIQKGALVDGFRVGDLLHTGGMATLRRVTRPGITMPLVMKVPALLEGEDPAAIVGFEMEQMILPRLSGPHVPKYVASGTFGAEPYLVMELIEGPTLLEKLEHLPLAVDEVASIGLRVAAALRDLHRQNVVHLDVKPSNVVARESGEAALVDFGLAHHDELPDLMNEEFRLPYGTAPYMAPEQVLGNRTDPRSDLFALGVLLYFFATGERPFGDPKGMSGLKRRLWRDPEPPRRLRPDLPPWLQEIVLRCLEVDPRRRYPTAAHLAFDLAHPLSVALTARSEKLARDPWRAVLRRRFHPDFQPPPARSVAARLEAAPIVLVAVDLTDAGDALLEAMRVTVRRLVAVVPGARFAIVNVLRHRRIGIDTTLDEEGRNKHVTRLAELKHWAQPLGLPEGRVTTHVLGATDPAEALLQYASANHVDHVVIGARTDASPGAFGSVSSQVATRAECSVTVVRPPRRAPEGTA